MKQTLIFGALAAFLLILLIGPGCDKEKIVNTKEYIHDTKYIETPPDTIILIDTVFSGDSGVARVDTVRIIDTVTQVNTIHDTVHTTITVHDTVVTTKYLYDTVIVRDTVIKTQYAANMPTAYTALQVYTDPMVLDYVYSEYQLEDGYIFYLTSEQMDVSQVSTGVYDIYGYLEFWASDWSACYPMEFYWRMTYKSGDPANSANWTISEPPSAVSTHHAGLTAKTPVPALK